MIRTLNTNEVDEDDSEGECFGNHTTEQGLYEGNQRISEEVHYSLDTAEWVVSRLNRKKPRSYIA